jgi:uncharacterized protein
MPQFLLAIYGPRLHVALGLHSSICENPISSISIYVMIVVFVATLIRSTFGFGEALIAVPLLSLRIPLRTAAPLAVLVSIAVAAVIVGQDWRKIHMRSAGGLVASTLVGIPVGLVLLTSFHQNTLKAALAVLIIVFAVYSLTGRQLPELHSENRIWLFACGFCAGVLGGAYGMNGPPLAIYGGIRRWSPERFRATLQGYFLPASLLGMLGYLFAGLWTVTVTRYFLLSLPVIIPTILLGRACNRRLQGAAFHRLVYLVVAVSGVVLLVQAVHQ